MSAASEMSPPPPAMASMNPATKAATTRRAIFSNERSTYQRHDAGSRTVQRPFTHVAPALHAAVAEHASPGIPRRGHVPMTIPVGMLHPPPPPPPLQREN